jgi:hypothetical protein
MMRAMSFALPHLSLRRFRPLRRLRAALALLGALAAGSSAGCWAYSPHLYSSDPAPNLPPNQLLLQVPPEVVDAMRQSAEVTKRDLAMSGTTSRIGFIELRPERADAVLEHRVLTGMTPQEVVWCFLAQPTRVRDQGPPGGHTLLWEPLGFWQYRYWVRFDETGHAVAAGVY